MVDKAKLLESQSGQMVPRYERKVGGGMKIRSEVESVSVLQQMKGTDPGSSFPARGDRQFGQYAGHM